MIIDDLAPAVITKISLAVILTEKEKKKEGECGCPKHKPDDFYNIYHRVFHNFLNANLREGERECSMETETRLEIIGIGHDSMAAKRNDILTITAQRKQTPVYNK